MTAPTTTTRLAALALTALLAAGCSTESTTGSSSAPTAPGRSPSDAPSEAAPDPAAAFAALEEQYHARLGVHAVDVGTGEVVSHREQERFAYASTLKALLAAALLDANEPADLARVVRWTEDELVDFSPVTETRVEQGLPLGEVAEAAVRESDNTAANIVIRELGGVSALAAALREVGDSTTRPVRLETALNTAVPGEVRDTSTPLALATTLQAYALDGALSPDDAAVLDDWMSGNATGDALVRAGFPDDWRGADKSGGGGYATRNDIAIAHPPSGDPVVVVVMSSRDGVDDEWDDALVADAARVVADQLAG